MRSSTILASLLAAGALSTSAVLASNDYAITYKEYTLPNGMHVILHRDTTVPIVATVVHYDVGSRNEDPKRTGFAHFFEHLMFEGTKDIPRAKLTDYIQDVGGQLNAFTSFDQTVYHFELPSNNIQLALWIEYQRMRQLIVDSIGVETQRGVVKEERNMRYTNTPYGDSFDNIVGALFSGTFYGWTPIGASQHIDSASIPEFRQFYDKYYQPSNATLVVSGDFDEKEVRRYVEEYFGSYPKVAKPEAPVFKMDPLTKEVRKVITDEKAQLPLLLIGYRGPKGGDPDAYAVQMLTDILSSGQSSRFYRRLVDQDQISVGAYSFLVDMQYSGAAALVGVAAPGKDIKQVEATMMEEIQKVIAEGVTDEEYQKARNIQEAKFLSSRKGALNKALALASAHVQSGNANFVNKELENFMKVKKEDLQRVAKKYFSTEGRAVVTYFPASGEATPARGE